MIFKYNLSISGDRLYPETIRNKILGDFIIDSSISPLNYKFENNSEIYEYGEMSFWHPKKFCTEQLFFKNLS